VPGRRCTSAIAFQIGERPGSATTHWRDSHNLFYDQQVILRYASGYLCWECAIGMSAFILRETRPCHISSVHSQHDPYMISRARLLTNVCRVTYATLAATDLTCIPLSNVASIHVEVSGLVSVAEETKLRDCEGRMLTYLWFGSTVFRLILGSSSTDWFSLTIPVSRKSWASWGGSRRAVNWILSLYHIRTDHTFVLNDMNFAFVILGMTVFVLVFKISES
jgi:hypothetical protein